MNSGKVWSAGFQPAGVEADSYEVEFSEDRAEIVRRDGTLTTTLEVVVSPEDDAEVRRVSITNLGSRVREVELTSYAEIVLATGGVGHRASGVLQDVRADRVRRRGRRDTGDAAAALAERSADLGGASGGGRRRVGRRDTVRDRPRAISRARPRRPRRRLGDRRAAAVGHRRHRARSDLQRSPAPAHSGGSDGARRVLDDRRADAGRSARPRRQASRPERVRARGRRWRGPRRRCSCIICGVDADEAHLFQRIANRVLYSDPTLRPSSDLLRRGEGGQSKLWPAGISGDLPIVLVRIDEIEDLEIVRELVRAHEYWRMKRLARRSGDPQRAAAVVPSGSARRARRHGAEPSRRDRRRAGRLRKRLRAARRPGFGRAAKRAADRRAGGAAEPARHLVRAGQTAGGVRAGRGPAAAPDSPQLQPGGRPSTARRDLEFFNGLGGFAADGREYVTILGEGQWTPAPWINVIANPSFGFQVSVEGAGYTWAINSQQHQITPWSNDPVSDRPGEVIYVRDLDTGELWGPTALPIREDVGAPYVVRHGHGYSRLRAYVARHRARADAIRAAGRLGQDFAAEDSQSLGRVRGVCRSPPMSNGCSALRAARRRRTSSPRSSPRPARYSRATLSASNTAAVSHSRILRGRQSCVDRGPDRVSSAATARSTIRRRSPPSRPLSPKRRRRARSLRRAANDGALRPDAATEVVFLLGEAANTDRRDRLDHEISRRRSRLGPGRGHAATGTTCWAPFRSSTPDRSMDIMLNRWLLYQTLRAASGRARHSTRRAARTAFAISCRT